MAALPEKRKWTASEYLVFEDDASTKHEFYFGDVFSMAGASEDHILITGNVFASLHQQLRKRDCRVYQSEMRIYISDDEQFYPDVAVVCGEPQFHNERRDIILNPQLIVEVLSPSTANFDRGGKFVSYRKLSSLQDYMLVSQDMMMIEHFRRQKDDTWLLSVLEDPHGQVMLDAISCQLAIADIYEKIVFGVDKN